jgi:tRNA threonylcarbamoyladenosine biosynthesis protein TsaE
MLLRDATATEAFGQWLGRLLQAGDVVALSGDLGVGKTCLARGILAGLGWVGDVPSPSFALVIPYETPDVRLPVWHVDLYRLNSAQEAESLALDDVLIDGALIVEWPERLGTRAWSEALWLRLDPDGNGRILTARVPPSWSARWSL